MEEKKIENICYPKLIWTALYLTKQQSTHLFDAKRCASYFRIIFVRLRRAQYF